MITDDKIKEIRKSLRSGIPEGEVKHELMAQGFTEEEIKQAFAPTKYDMRSWYLVFAIIFVLIGIWLLLKNNSIWFLIFAIAMFYVYYLEVKKHK